MPDNGLQGARGLRNRFKQYSKRATTKIDKALLSGGYAIEAEAKLNVTVDTGYLRNTISTRLIKSGNKSYVEVGTNLEYAVSIEFGLDPGTMPPVEALEPWVRRVILGGIEVYAGEARDIAFAVAKGIEKWGTNPQPFLHPAYESNIGDIRVSIKQAVREARREI